MNHNHEAQDDTTQLKLAFFLNLGFTILEIIGGVWTNSMAIVADALHDLGDSLSLAMAWFLEQYAQKGHDTHYSYGYRRYSLLGALVNTLVLIGGGLAVLSQTIPRLITPEPTNVPGMIGFALLGIVVNGLAVVRVKRGQSLNTQVVAWHLLEDVLGWIAVLVVSMVLLFTNFYILDPILSILITLYVLYNVVKNLKKTLAIFLQAVPGDVNLANMEQKIGSIAGVRSVHHTHVWSLDGDHHVLTTHVVVDDEATKAEILQIKKEALAVTGAEDFEHVTIEIEYENERCRLL
ncbi:MAG: cation transporter [Anaerolineae bacterium]|nr:cation transporter [Anaerolineae bacterium]